MNTRNWIGWVLAASMALGGTACSKPVEDWTSAEYVKGRLAIHDERAYAEFANLTPEAQASLVPTLIEIYNGGLKKDRALQALVTAASPEAKAVYLSALASTDDAEAGLAARGLAAINDTASAQAIAQRLGQVSKSDAYSPFLEALRKIPTPQAADVLAEVLMRPVSRIGGIDTVRLGCTMLGSVPNPSSAVIDALVFSLVNFNPQPFQDAINECELALLQHGDAAVPALIKAFKSENTAINQHLVGLKYPMLTGQLRAGAILSHINSATSQAALQEYFRTPHPVPRGELVSMTTQEQQTWYDQSGQLFSQAVQGLAYADTPASLETIRLLESLETPGSLLVNFREWFDLSAGAEFGIRTAVHDALSKVGEDVDRELLWTRAMSGALTTGRGAYFNNEMRKNALHYLGRTAKVGEIARFDAVVAAQPSPADFGVHKAYWLLAEECKSDVECYGAKLRDPAAVVANPAIQAAAAAVSDAAQKQGFLDAAGGNVRTGALWQLALTFGGQPRAGELLAENLELDSISTRFTLAEALLNIDVVPASLSTKVDEFMQKTNGQQAPQLREIRFMYTLVKHMRT